MSNQNIITLLSDFGSQDVYVGVMKGVIAQINPQVKVIDLTHQIPTQNILAGRFSLLNAYPYFPAGTVHVAVIDPGVGSNRRGVAIKLAHGYLVGPDNGLFSGVLELFPPIAAIELNNPDYWRTNQPSNTFHGRDIFASVGAHLAKGISLHELGTPIEPSSLIKLPIPEYQLTATGIIGYIQYIDHFGNLITNIPRELVAKKNWFVKLENFTISSAQTYSSAKLGATVALVGSHGWVEIAVNSGNAQSSLPLTWLDPVEIVWENQD